VSEGAAVPLSAAGDGRGALVRRDGVHFRRPAEMDRIAQLTRGRAVILGRRTFAAFAMIPPDRWYLVLTRDEDLLAEGGVRYLSGYGFWFVPCFEEALHSARSLSRRASSPELFVAGGPAAFGEALPLAGRVYLLPGGAPPLESGPVLPSRATKGWRSLFAEPGGSAAFEIIERMT